MEEQQTETWYSVEPGILQNLGEFLELCCNLEDISNIGVDNIIHLAEKINAERQDTNIRQMLALNDLVVGLGIDDYPIDIWNISQGNTNYRSKEADPEGVWKIEDGELSINGDKAQKLVHENVWAYLTIGDTLIKVDPYEEIRELINEAFSQVNLFSGGNWEEINSDLVEDLPQAIRDEIIKTVTLLDHDRDYPQYKVIRRLILQHLGII